MLQRPSSYPSGEVSEVVGHAEEASAKHPEGGGEAVVDDAGGVSDSQRLQTLAGGHWKEPEGKKKKKIEIEMTVLSEKSQLLVSQWFLPRKT